MYTCHEKELIIEKNIYKSMVDQEFSDKQLIIEIGVGAKEA